MVVGKFRCGGKIGWIGGSGSVAIGEEGTSIEKGLGEMKEDCGID